MASDFGDSIRGCLTILLLVVLLVSNGEGFVSATSQEENGHFKTVPLSYILGQADGYGSSSGRMVSEHLGGRPALEVVHNQNTLHLDPSEMWRLDEARVKWLMSKMIPVHNNDVAKSDFIISSSSDVSIPTNAGFNVGTGNYLVTVGLGTPATDLRLVMDTGSPKTWTQCQPCETSCYQQADPLFDTSSSSTYSNIPCTSSTCKNLYNGSPPPCTSDGTCSYYISYGDKSHSSGPLATDTLTLTSSVNLPNYVFGCGQDNVGFRGSDGLFGLSNDGAFSMVTQGAYLFGEYFSYCLPSTTSSSGFLILGKTTESAPSSTSLGFTPIITVPENPQFYGIKIIGISVGGVSLSESSSQILSDTSSIIDSGTVVTRLPPSVYSELRSKFRKGMTQYPMVKGDGTLDTCYDLRKYKYITHPKIEFSFSGGLTVELNYSGIFFMETQSRVCLAFATPNEGSDFIIYGNVQQRTFDISYDVANQQLGFSANAC